MQYFGVPLVPANVLSWLVAISNSYVLNSLVTFARESSRELRWRTYATFLGAGLAGLIVNTTVLVVAVSLMPRLIADPALQLAAAKALRDHGKLSGQLLAVVFCRVPAARRRALESDPRRLNCALPTSLSSGHDLF